MVELKQYIWSSCVWHRCGSRCMCSSTCPSARCQSCARCQKWKTSSTTGKATWSQKNTPDRFAQRFSVVELKPNKLNKLKLYKTVHSVNLLQLFQKARETPWCSQAVANLVWFSSRRKFTSQTSDNMDRWKSRGGKSQRREEKKREDQRRKRVKKEDAGEKVEMSRFTAFFSINLWLRRVEK